MGTDSLCMLTYRFYALSKPVSPVLVVFASCKDTDFASFLPKFLSIFIGYGDKMPEERPWLDADATKR